MHWWDTFSSFLHRDERPLLVPEVVQTSMMDCGPASLKALLQGYGINISYNRLREACQTDVDGTSIESLEDLAVQLGLDAIQVMLPTDHLLLPAASSLPALAVVRQPSGFTHFIIIWRLHGHWVQIMDPASGRQWVSRQSLIQRLYIHRHQIAQQDWFAWASGSGFLEPLSARLLSLCADPVWVEETIAYALRNDDWQELASLDAATRMVQSLSEHRHVIQSEAAAGELINRLQQQADMVPLAYWSVEAVPDDPESVMLQGAVIINIAGIREEQNPEDLQDLREDNNETTGDDRENTERLRESLSEQPPEPTRHIWSLLRQDGLLSPAFVLAGVVIAGLGTALEILVVRGLVEIGNQLPLFSQQLEVLTLFLLFILSFLLLEWLLDISTLRMGRRLEIRLRQQFLEKLPRLGDRYFRSRLTSDLIQRAHELHSLRTLPEIASGFLQSTSQLLFVSLGLMIIYPQGFLLVLACTGLIIITSLLSRPLTTEQDMRFRTHTGSLGRFYMDALQGLLPIRSHGAENAVKTEHESHLVEWFKAGASAFNAVERIMLLNVLLETLISIWLVYSYLQSGGSSSGTLVLIYWLMLLPQLGLTVMESAQQYPALHNRLLRILEPLHSPDEGYQWYPEQAEATATVDADNAGLAAQSATPSTAAPIIPPIGTGLSVEFSEVNLVLSGRTVLENITATLQAGEHVAIVGSSGAGKSSLAGLLLGWYGPASGYVSVGGQLLEDTWLQHIRENTAWLDPDIQLWNRSLRANVQYGQDGTAPLDPALLVRADLTEVVRQLPQGEETLLGEGGKRLSGGEGQRVRLGRAMQHENPGLVIMDEPFRGLTRDQRHHLLGQSRQHWQSSTLLFISHDIEDTLEFDRVWVIENGQLVEDDQPGILMEQAGSRYAELLSTERSIRQTIWGSARWSRFFLEKGKLNIRTAQTGAAYE